MSGIFATFVAPPENIPQALFLGGAQGAWYDPSDNSTMFQDAAGTTAVTAVEQVVGLILDKRNGLGIGSEVISNNTFDSDTVWTKGTGWSIGSGVATKTAGSASNLSQTVTLTAGTTYRVVYTITRTAGTITPQFSGGSTVTGTARSASGTYVENLTAVSGNTTFEFAADASFAGTVDNVYLKRVSGNDAFQTTSASRPTLRARYNLLTYSEQFDNAAWAATNVTVTNSLSPVAPDGTATAETLTASGANGTVLQSITAIAGGHTFSVYLRRRTGTGNIDIQAGDGVYSTVTLTSDWQRFTVAATLTAGARTPGIRIVTSGDAVDAWGAQLVQTNAFPSNTYQRIAAATDYDTGVNFPQYLAFDGSDDSLLTTSVNFTGGDKVMVFSGVTKLSDAAAGTIIELSATLGSNNGVFLMRAPDSTAPSYYGWYSKGTAYNGNATATSATYASPSLVVFTGIGDIAGRVQTLRLNGTQAATSAVSQGTGNYGNFPMYIGRRNNATLPFSGRLYSLIVCAAASNTTQIAQTERYIAAKTPLGTI